ncbi:MAG TPA: 50S ribosomal protein L19, partial [Acidobacteriota bacterium]|nr:50S ribosomal protein L19 [Acidobacteriota bacterium]
MNQLVDSIEKAQMRQHPEFIAGDTIRVHVRIKEG